MITEVRHSFGTIETQPLFKLLITSLVRNHKFKRYTSKFFVSAEGLISSCYLSSFTVCLSLHFLLCEKIHYFFKMPRFCSVIITHFSFTVTASFLSKKVRTSVSQSVSQWINRSINQSINIQLKPRSSGRPNQTFRSPSFFFHTRRVRCPMSAPPHFLSYPIN